MRKILLLLVMCVMATAAWADDVIVGLDGFMTLSKVVEITQTEIKYKKAGNLEGPTFSVLKSQVKSILYENGTTEEIAQVLMKDMNVKYGRNFKLASWMVGGSMFLAGMIVALKASSDFDEGKIDEDAQGTRYGWSYTLMGLGAASWGVFYFRGRAMEREAERYRVSQTPVAIIPMKGNRQIEPCVDVFCDTQMNGKQELL